MKKLKTLKSIIKQGNFSERETKLIEKAYFFAEESHKGQLQGKMPFFNHPAYVGYLLAKWKQRGEVVSAGLLHDVIEESEVKLAEIKREFGNKVAFYVDGMSWSKINVKGKWIKDYEGYFKKFSDYVKKDPILAIIKSSDELSRPNPKSARRVMSSLKEKGIWEDYKIMVNGRMRGFWIPFFKEIGFSKLAKKIELKGKFVEKEVSNIKLSNYLSKKELKLLKIKLRKEGFVNLA